MIVHHNIILKYRFCYVHATLAHIIKPCMHMSGPSSNQSILLASIINITYNYYNHALTISQKLLNLTHSGLPHDVINICLVSRFPGPVALQR